MIKVTIERIELNNFVVDNKLNFEQLIEIGYKADGTILEEFTHLNTYQEAISFIHLQLQKSILVTIDDIHYLYVVRVYEDDNVEFCELSFIQKSIIEIGYIYCASNSNHLINSITPYIYGVKLDKNLIYFKGFKERIETKHYTYMIKIDEERLNRSLSYKVKPNEIFIIFN